jgi:hypothetical protein
MVPENDYFRAELVVPQRPRQILLYVVGKGDPVAEIDTVPPVPTPLPPLSSLIEKSPGAFTIMAAAIGVAVVAVIGLPGRPRRSRRKRSSS